MAKILANAPKTEFEISINTVNDETYKYGHQIVKCLSKAGWALPDSAVYDIGTTGGKGDVDGIIINVNNPKRLSPSVIALAEALRTVGIDYKINGIHYIKPNNFELYTGNKSQL